VNNRMSP